MFVQLLELPALVGREARSNISHAFWWNAHLCVSGSSISMGSHLTESRSIWWRQLWSLAVPLMAVLVQSSRSRWKMSTSYYPCLLSRVVIIPKTNRALGLTRSFVLLHGSGGNLGCGLNIPEYWGFPQKGYVFENKFVLENMGHIFGKDKSCVCFQVVLPLVPCCSGGGVGISYWSSLPLEGGIFLAPQKLFGSNYPCALSHVLAFFLIDSHPFSHWPADRK